ncbi:MAG: hypothetical protein QW728_01335 [Thermoplasmata archaeon]
MTGFSETIQSIFRDKTRVLIILMSTAALLRLVMLWSSTFDPPWHYPDLYHHYADLVFEGKIPYRDFTVEYPQLAILIFLIPKIVCVVSGNEALYRPVYVTMTFAADMVNVFLVYRLTEMYLTYYGPRQRVLSRKTGNHNDFGEENLEPDQRRVFELSLIYAGSPIAAYLSLYRYDVFVILLVLIALNIFMKRIFFLQCGIVTAHCSTAPAWILLGFAACLKWYPALLAIPFFSAEFIDKKKAFRMATLFVAVVIAVMLPFILLSPEGFLNSYTFHFSRYPNRGSILVPITTFLGLDRNALNKVSLVIMLSLLAIISFYSFKHPQKILQSSSMLVITFVLFNKVFSTQFVLWYTSISAPLVYDGWEYFYLGVAQVFAWIELPVALENPPSVIGKWAFTMMFLILLLRRERIIAKVKKDLTDIIHRRQKFLQQHPFIISKIRPALN